MIGKCVKQKYPGLCKAGTFQSLSSANRCEGLVGGAVFHGAFATVPLFYFSQVTEVAYLGYTLGNGSAASAQPFHGKVTDVLALLLSSEGMSPQ